MHRPVYTLAQLMVAIGIVAIVCMLVPPWIGRARTDGRANTCRNNLRNLSLATIFYESQRGHFPGYSEDIDRTPTISPNDDRSWIFVLLPYLDKRSVFEALRDGEVDNDQINQTLELCTCPSVPPERLGRDANCYVANTGLLDVLPIAGPLPFGRSYDFAANGVFHNRAAPASADIPIVTMTSNYIHQGDGLGTTLMLSENADASRWTGGPIANHFDIRPREHWMGFTWHYADGRPGSPAAPVPLEPLGINVRTGGSHRVRALARGFARPSSHHPGGVNMAFCDGHVRFIGQNMSYRVYQALMTPRGGEAMYNFDVDDGVPSPQPLPENHAARQKVDEADIR